jgi:hypothetical protein
MTEDGNNCNGECCEIYLNGNCEHSRKRVGGEKILGSKLEFCAAFYHVNKWHHDGKHREHFCLDQNCIIVKRAISSKNWFVQPLTVVAVVKFECGDETLYEARYTNCRGEGVKHAEEFFQEDIQNGELAGIVQATNEGTITMYLTLQPCNRPDQSFCNILRTIFQEILQPNGRNINLCVKAAHTCRLGPTTMAAEGIKQLMLDGVNVSQMTQADWHYLLSLTNELENGEYLEVHEGRQDLDGCVQNIFDQIQQEIDQDKINQDEIDQA